MVERIWTLSNILSLIRVLLVIPIAYLMINDQSSHKIYVIGLIIIASLTDFLDGKLARKLHQVTELGKIIDPVADKIAVIIVCLVLVLQEKIPFWFFIAAALRDVLIFIGGMYMKKKRGIVLQSNLIGKWTVSLVAILIVVAIIDDVALVQPKNWLLVLCSFLLIVSFGLYFKRFINEIRNPRTSRLIGTVGRAKSEI